MAFKKTKPNELIVDDISELGNLPTDKDKGNGGKSEDDNMQVPVGTSALFGTGEVAVLFPHGWEEI